MAELVCQQLVELVTDYFEEALSPEQQVRFEAHLAECGYCRLYVDQMQTTVRLLGTLNRTDVEPAMMEEILQVFRSWKDSK